MSRKIEINRLDKEELAYELAWRGIGEGSVEEMRSRLALARQMERSGESPHYPSYPFTFQEDAAVVTKKLDDLMPVLDGFADTTKSGLYLKLQTKLSHVLGRLDNMKCGTPDEVHSRGVLVAQVLTMLDQLNVKASQASSSSQPIPPNLCVLQGSLQLPVSSSSFSTPFQAPMTASTPTPCSCSMSSHIKPILPHKWNLKFSADRRGMSVTAFFERVEELRRARGVPKDVLLESGIDLFEGRAYEFFQDCRNEVPTWDEMVSRFKEEYQPAFYSERLLEEIKRRTQGPDESIGTYMAVMSRYFQRLQCPISEEAKLTLLLRNIAPRYQAGIGALEINNIAELKSLCRRIEQRTVPTDYPSTSRKAHVLEPDLACAGMEAQLDEMRVSDSRSQVRPVNHRETKKEIVCFNCQKPGHRAVGCVERRRIYCYGCKKEGVVRRKCPNCNQGNAQRRS